MKKWILVLICGMTATLASGKNKVYDLEEIRVTEESLVKTIDSIIYQLKASDFECRDNVKFSLIPHSIIGDTVLQFDAICSDFPIEPLSQYFFRYNGYIFYLDAKNQNIDRFFSTTGRTERFVVPDEEPVPAGNDNVVTAAMLEEMFKDSTPEIIASVETCDDSNPAWMVIFRDNRFRLLTDWVYDQKQGRDNFIWRKNEDTRYYDKILFGGDK